MKAAVDNGHSVSRACRVLDYPRSSYYESLKPAPALKQPAIDEGLAEQIREVIKENPEFGYRRVWAYLKFRQGVDVGRNRVHRIIKLKGWQATPIRRPRGNKVTGPEGRKRTTVADPKTKIVVDTPNTRWATDLTKVYVEEAGWMNLIPVIDCCSARIVSYVFSDRGRSLEAITAVEDAVLSRFGAFDAVPEGLALRTDNGSIFLSKSFLKCIKNVGITQEFTPYHCPSANGVVERWNKTFKEECAWCYSFKTIDEAERVIDAWIDKYNHERMHSRLGYASPVEFEDALQENAA